MDLHDPPADPMGPSPANWSRLVEAVVPATLLLVIASRMGERLRGKITPEDILQEALLMAWRDRARHTWRGVRAFRNWLLSIIDHRISDARDRVGAAKRGRDVGHFAIGVGGIAGASGAMGAEPWSSTTPSRVVWHRQQADAIEAAMESLQEEVRAVVRLRLIEQMQIGEIAVHLGLSESAARRRFRQGAEMFRRRMTKTLGTTMGRRVDSEFGL